MSNLATLGAIRLATTGILRTPVKIWTNDRCRFE